MIYVWSITVNKESEETDLIRFLLLNIFASNSESLELLVEQSMRCIAQWKIVVRNASQ